MVGSMAQQNHTSENNIGCLNFPMEKTLKPDARTGLRNHSLVEDSSGSGWWSGYWTVSGRSGIPDCRTSCRLAGEVGSRTGSLRTESSDCPRPGRSCYLSLQASSLGFLRGHQVKIFSSVR